jgi:ketosteroid isomerase-like protein
MRTLKLVAAVLATLGAAVPTPGVCQAPVAPVTTGVEGAATQEIRALQARLTEAFLKSDTAFLERYLAEDYTATYVSGQTYTKAQVIEAFRSGATRYESIEERELKIRPYGDVVVASTLFTVRAVTNGKPFQGDVRNTRIWVKRGGDWSLVAFQNTAVASPSR